MYWIVNRELWTCEAERWKRGFIKIPNTYRKIKDFPDRETAEKALKELIENFNYSVR